MVITYIRYTADHPLYDQPWSCHFLHDQPCDQPNILQSPCPAPTAGGIKLCYHNCVKKKKDVPPGTEAHTQKMLKPGKQDNMMKADDIFVPSERPLIADGIGTKARRGTPRFNKDDKFLQGTHLLARRVMLNETIEALSKQFGMSPHAVSQRLAMARTQDLQQLARDIVAEQLLPKALAVVDMHLHEGSYEAAKDVLFGTAILQKQAKTEIHHSSTPTLDQIRAERAKRAIIDVQVKGDDVAPSDGDGNTSGNGA